MSGQLIPPPELAPQLPTQTSAAEALAIWVDLMKAGDKLLIAGLRRSVGSDGDLNAAAKNWYERVMQEHHQTVQRMILRDRSPRS